MIISTQKVAVIKNKDGNYLENSFNGIATFHKSLAKAIKYYDTQLAPNNLMTGRQKAEAVIAKLGLEDAIVIDAELIHEIKEIEVEQ